MSPQLDLFGPAAEPDPAAKASSPAERDAQLVELASRLPQPIRLGTSSWAFAGWTGVVYERPLPPPVLSRDGLPTYARHPLLRTVGLDRTFYAPIPADEYRRLAEQVPPGFTFLVKAPQMFTSRFRYESREPSPEYLDPSAAADLFVGPCMEGLGACAGPLVFQFPPQGRAITRKPAAFADRLAGFLAALPRGPLYAVELRDRELLAPEVMRTLESAGARLCLGVHARMPPVDIQAAAATSLGPGPLVIRWNLHAGYAYEEAKSRYAPFDRLVDEDPATRASIATLAREAAARGDPVWIIANNKAEGSAPLTLERLARAIVDPGSA
ncbi:MAG: DUF72 domain-containing protein [Betaproteobacteria bacterium]|nr:DUF72 domain-containing protein [Betaproteobacteria bacterium]